MKRLKAGGRKTAEKGKTEMGVRCFDDAQVHVQSFILNELSWRFHRQNNRPARQSRSLNRGLCCVLIDDRGSFQI